MTMDQEVDALFVEQRRRLRPTLADAVATVGRLLSDVAEGGFRQRPPVGQTWSWEDAHGKVISVGPADLPGTPDDGYPYIQVQQPVVPSLGTYITSTTLLMGPDEAGITRAVTAVLVNHLGAYNGLLAVARRIVTEDSTSAGLDAAAEINEIGSKSISRAALDEMLVEVERIIGGGEPGSGSQMN